MLKKTQPSLKLRRANKNSFAKSDIAFGDVGSFDDRKKMINFFVLLVQVDRVNAKKIKGRRSPKVKLKDRNIGPPIRGPYLFKILNLSITNLSLNII